MSPAPAVLSLDLHGRVRLAGMGTMLGSTILREIIALPPAERQDKILEYLRKGEVPSWMLQWRPVRVEAMVGGKPYTLEYFVRPDYVSLGTDEDYFRVPLIPRTAQAYADDNDAILPSRRMVNEIYANASARLIPQSIYPNLEKVEDWGRHEIMVQKQMATHGLRAGTFLAGHMKDIVIPSTKGRVAIYGWHDESGQLTQGKANAPIQPYSTIHDDLYTDYSHGTRLVRRSATLNGQPVDLYTIFADPNLSVLVSDQGAFAPRYGDARTSVLSTLTRNEAASVKEAFQKGNDVLAAQMALNLFGGYGLAADGVLGPKTAAALRDFQGKQGLPVTGKLDEATKQKLSSMASTQANTQRLKTVGLAAGAAALLYGGWRLVKSVWSAGS